MIDGHEPEWKSKYLAAILEIDNRALVDRITEAEVAISERLQSLDGKPDVKEVAALEVAISGLGLLREERLT